MGGALALAIRRLNGTEYISERWTNPLPHWLSNPGFWDDGTVVDEYIKAGLDQFKPVDRVFPDEYGTVLIDFVSKRVFSRQDYCGIGQTVCAAVDKEDAAHLLEIIKRGWVTKYEVSRHGDLRREETEEEHAKRVADDQLHPDEVEAFHAHLTKLLGGDPRDRDGWTSHKPFNAGMVILHWQVPGWTFDDGKLRDPQTGQLVEGSERAWQCWSEVQAFVKETGWKSGVWSQEEVDRQYADTMEPGEADEEEDDEADADRSAS